MLNLAGMEPKTECPGTKPPKTERTAKAVIFGKKEKVADLFQLLESRYNKVTLTETEYELEQLAPERHAIGLAIMTDSFPVKLSAGLLHRVRRKLAPQNMICLSADIDHEKEKNLRSAGLIFLGSYRSFFAYAERIITQTQTDRNQKPMDQRKDSAMSLEKRLSGRFSTLRSRLKRTVFGLSAMVAEAVVRLIEISVGLVVTFLLFLPMLIVLAVRKLFTGTPVFSRHKVFGVAAKPMTIQRFNTTATIFSGFPLFLELFTGRLALVGTAIREEEDGPGNAEDAYIKMIKPGIVSLWDIRRSTKIAHEGKAAIEWEYIFRKRPFYDLLLFLRAFPALLYQEQNRAPSPVFHLLGLDIDNITMEEAVSIMRKHLEQKKQCSIFFVNPDCLNKMVDDPDYFSTLQKGDYIFPDGIGLSIAGKLLQTPLRENINGTDMLPYLCTMASEDEKSLFLLGSKPGVAKTAAEKIKEAFDVTIAGTANGYFDHDTQSDTIIETINNSGASILLVAFGAPRQEKWIARYRGHLKPEILIGVGGLFDFYSGNINRAPEWMREIGLEWVYRIMQEPGRMWRRYIIGNPVFLYRVMKWKLFTRSMNP